MRNVVKGVLCALALVCAFALGQGDKGYTESDLALAREEAFFKSADKNNRELKPLTFMYTHYSNNISIFSKSFCTSHICI